MNARRLEVEFLESPKVEIEPRVRRAAAPRKEAAPRPRWENLQRSGRDRDVCGRAQPPR